jgi:fatty acid-binding protein DegV
VEENGCDTAVVVTPAIEFAAMYRNACLAAELATRPTVAIDARTAAAGQALVVLAGAAVAARGGDLAEVVAAVEDATRRVELVASLANLDPLRRSGPVPDSVLGAGGLDGARSVFRMCDGTIEPLGEAADAESTLETIRAAFVASTPGGVERSTVFHAGAPELAHRLEELLGGVDFVSGFSAAMQIHTGAGVVGAAWLPARADG